jgi:hypothetical protein
VGEDTLIQMSVSDAKIIFKSLLDCEITDSLLNVYTLRDTLNNNVIRLQKKEISLLKEKVKNQEQISANLNDIIGNKYTEIDILNQTIKEQKKQNRKQKVIKTIALIGDVVLPVVTLFAVLKFK